ncbi:MAG TPA: hypothetical protein VL972_08315 [Solirubrobacteraceae bacterium]|nr:hypothetical protein [Solirubrobacteraceae bacterium]
MALRSLSPQELAQTPSLFSSFMGRPGRSQRTIGELVAIYRERRAELRAEEDADDALRVERFKHDMANRRWRDEVVLRIGVFGGQTRVIDGTHRGIAYLACLQEGVSRERLPPLHVDC